MKHSIQFGALALAVAALAAGCTKDGKFNPSEKISRVYEAGSSTFAYYDGTEWQTSSENTPKHLSEQWTWDGKKLSSIAYYDEEGASESSFKFEYDGSQLSKITNANTVITFAYDGSKLESAAMTNNGTKLADYTFTHDGSKISEIKIDINQTYLNTKAARSLDRAEKTMWQVLLPCDIRALSSRECAAKRGGDKSSFTYTVKLTWDGKNISKAEASIEDYTTTVAYTYDNKKNPYRGFLLALVVDESFGFYSKNNVLTITETGSDGESEQSTFTYEYDGNWPTQCSTTESESTDGYRYTYSHTTYYEYAD